MRDEETKAGRNHSHNMQRLLKKKKKNPPFLLQQQRQKNSEKSNCRLPYHTEFISGLTQLL